MTSKKNRLCMNRKSLSHLRQVRETNEVFPEDLSVEKTRLACPIEDIGTQTEDRNSGEKRFSFSFEFGGLEAA